MAVTPIAIVAMPALTFYLTYRRCRNSGYAVITTLVAWFGVFVHLGLTAHLSALVHPAFRVLLFIYPPVLIGDATGSSAGWYVGVVIQLAVGVWLMGGEPAAQADAPNGA